MKMMRLISCVAVVLAVAGIVGCPKPKMMPEEAPVISQERPIVLLSRCPLAFGQNGQWYTMQQTSYVSAGYDPRNVFIVLFPEKEGLRMSVVDARVTFLRPAKTPRIEVWGYPSVKGVFERPMEVKRIYLYGPLPPTPVEQQ